MPGDSVGQSLIRAGRSCIGQGAEAEILSEGHILDVAGNRRHSADGIQIGSDL
jgi:hypothetical protein